MSARACQGLFAASPVSVYGSIGRHAGYFEQPQNLPPAFAPVFAVRSAIGLPHFGHTGASLADVGASGAFVVAGVGALTGGAVAADVGDVLR